jgi:hypothetical protein
MDDFMRLPMPAAKTIAAVGVGWVMNGCGWGSALIVIGFLARR